MRRAIVALALAVVMSALGGGWAQAADAPRASVADIEGEVMCVACGVPLDIAESPQATSERSYIRSLVNRGLTKDQVKTKLVEQYGPRVLALPKDKGFGRAAYIVPIALVALMLIALAIFLPRWRRNRDADDPQDQSPTLTDADARRLDEDLARYDV
jgi:cytochrome c-type biogenesis protein CcmH